MAKRKGLGKGLDALFEDNNTSTTGEEAGEFVKISEIVPNKSQPRKNFDAEALQSLADSIRQHGIIQPLVLRGLPTGGYQIVAGERRYRASRIAGLTQVPAIVRDFTDKQTMEIALIENLQREDLNPIEEAMGYKELMENYSFTQNEVSKSVGKSRPAVTNALRLLNLPDSVRDLVKEGSLSQGHARAILSLDDEAQMQELANKVVDNNLSVREVERIIKNQKSEQGDSENSSDDMQKQLDMFSPEDTYYTEMQIALQEALGRKVNISFSENKGKLMIEFYSKEELQDLAERLTNNC